MADLKLIRAFTFLEHQDITSKGLVLPNDQKWNMYASEVWPPGLAFHIWTPETQKKVELLATDIASLTNDPLPDTPQKFVYPGVGIITCPASLFDEFKKGFIGIHRTGGEVVWNNIETPEEASHYDEFTVNEKFLTPDWLIKLNAQIGFYTRLSTFSYEVRYIDFGSILKSQEGTIRKNK